MANGGLFVKLIEQNDTDNYCYNLSPIIHLLLLLFLAHLIYLFHSRLGIEQKVFAQGVQLRRLLDGACVVF